MERVTVSLDEALLAQFDALVARKGYGNRSEAVRDILRDRLEGERLASGEAPHSIGCLSYIYDHHERALSQRLTTLQHAHHDLIRSTTHVHLDHDSCMEVAILEGATQAVIRFADAIAAETGVRHGKLNLVPVDRRLAGSHHHHDHLEPHGRDGDEESPHVHTHPKS